MEMILSWFRSLFSVIKTFELKDAVDILCVTFIIYILIKFIRDTKAVQLMKGAVMLMVVYVLASFFNLTMLSALLRMFVEFGVLIILIIFQPEIRNGLEKLGRNNFSQKIGIGISKSYDDDETLALQRKCISDVVAISQSFS
ncbi:MAG: hypothetical protein IJU14_05590, partial [Clostridia bacterium]|nr:hypothetical protein [Clostridia bacterium]